MCHKPDDELAPEDGEATECDVCRCALVATAEHAWMLKVMHPVCFDCSRKGPDFIKEHLRKDEP